MRLTAKLELPNMIRSLPGRCFRLEISSAMFSLISRELFHPTFSSVQENTILGIAFISSAMIGSSLIADAVGQ